MTALLAFTPDQVAKVTGLSRSQLRYWDQTGFFRSRCSEQRGRFKRMYSFKDVVGLRILAKLRTHGVSLQELRKVGGWLHDRYDEPWSTLKFSVLDKKPVFESQAGSLQLAGGQTLLSVDLAAIEREIADASRALLQRTPEQIGRVVRNRYVQHNAWVLDGTRIPTSAVWDFFDAGHDVDSIQREYPRLTVEDIASAIEFERKLRPAKAG